MNFFTFTKLGRTLLLAAVMVIGAAGLSGSTFSVYGQTKSDDIITLFRISGIDKMVDQMLGSLPKAAFDGVDRSRLRNVMVSALFDEYIPLYNKYYTHDDIKQLIKFYESPIGKRSVEVSSLVASDFGPSTERLTKKLLKELGH